MRTPSPRCRHGSVRLYRYRPGQDADGGAVADLSNLIAADVDASVQPGEVTQEVVGNRVRQTVAYDVYLYADYSLATKDLIQWVDAAGITHKLFVVGQLPQIGLQTAWRVRAKEVL